MKIINISRSEEGSFLFVKDKKDKVSKFKLTETSAANLSSVSNIPLEKIEIVETDNGLFELSLSSPFLCKTLTLKANSALEN